MRDLKYNDYSSRCNTHMRNLRGTVLRPNALLRGEQRNTKAAAYHLNH